MLEVNSQPKTTIGTILDSCFSNEIFIKLQSWAEGVSESYHMACQVNLLKAYDSMLSNSNRHSHCVLVHKPILLPLLRLLHWCNETVEERNHVPCGIDKDFVVLLNQISRKMSQDITLLHFLFNFNEDTSDGDGENNVEAMNTSFGSFKSTNSNSSSNRFLVFSLLIPYLYGPGDIGQLAKDSVLSILAVSAKFRAVASYITKKTSFCQVLSGGLCALYSLLPRHIGAALQVSQNWHKLIIPNDILLLPSLTDLHDSLIFLNAIVEVSHPMIKMEIVSNFYKGLLVEVMKPGFIQGDSDEFLSQIVYLNLMFETFTDEVLVHALLKLLLREEWKGNEMANLSNSYNISDDNYGCERLSILDLILVRMRETDRLTNVVLSFLYTLMNLVCEDVMWNQVFRYIITKVYISNPVTDFDSKKSVLSAEQYLSFIPFCIKNLDLEEDNENNLISKGSLSKHCLSSRTEIIEVSIACLSWKWPYDGRLPNKFLNDSCDSPPPPSIGSSNFTRFGSARSSLISSVGGNRYFNNFNRSAHTTLDTQGFLDVIGNSKLNELGEEDEDDKLNELGEEDEDEFSDEEVKFDKILEGDEEGDEDGFLPLPPNDSQFDQMTQSNMEYLHLTYDDLSDDENDDKNNDIQKVDEYQVPINYEEIEKKIENVRSNIIEKLNFSEKCSTSEFLDKLKEINSPKNKRKGKKRLEENIAFIESKLQYLKEIQAECEEEKEEKDINESMSSPNININLSLLNDIDSKEKYTGIPIELPYNCHDPNDYGLLLNRLFDLLESLVENNYTTNLLLIALLRTLLSFPQPILRAFMLYPSKNPANLSPILHIFNSLKAKIDHFAQEIDGFDVLYVRALKHLNKKGEIYEKNLKGNGIHKEYYSDNHEDSNNDKELISRNSSSRKSSRLSNLFRFGRKTSTEKKINEDEVDDSDFELSRSGRSNSSFSTTFDITSNNQRSSNYSSAVYRYFSHKALESKANTEDATHNKRVVYAAICMTEMAQMFAAFSLEHSITICDAVSKYIK
uniref:DUF5917 domain-containing protein n=1 Tax=Strongyloides papillosus TaxID=174720 RepID=A0A0N5BML0_STREA